MKLSVIVPIYGVENFIKRCIVSLMKQTLQDVEFIFVDDASPDCSIEILKKELQHYPGRLPYVKIITHKVNKGLPAARNTGLAAATGDYIYHCDSDDFLELDMLESLYNAAIQNEADFVWSDWYLSYQNKERYMKQPDYTSSLDALKGMLADGMKYNVWNKLVKRDLYVQNQILFPSGHSMGEDMTMIRLAACAKKVAYVPGAFYHYVKTNAEAMTQAFNEHHLVDVRYNLELTLNFLQQQGLTAMLEREIAFFKLNTKLPFLITDDWESYRRWNEWYPEANAYIMQNKRLALRTRIVQKFASLKVYPVVWMYYEIVYRFIYRWVYQR